MSRLDRRLAAARPRTCGEDTGRRPAVAQLESALTMDEMP